MKPGQIEIKSPDVLRGLLGHQFSPLLSHILIDVAEKLGVVITESYRKQRHANDLHGTDPVRAIDIRSWCYAYPEAVANHINDRWIYDPGRPDMKCALLHDAGKGIHFHIQVHPYTRRR